MAHIILTIIKKAVYYKLSIDGEEVMDGTYRYYDSNSEYVQVDSAMWKKSKIILNEV
jgi:hypothetical protein